MVISVFEQQHHDRNLEYWEMFVKLGHDSILIFLSIQQQKFGQYRQKYDQIQKKHNYK